MGKLLNETSYITCLTLPYTSKYKGLHVKYFISTIVALIAFAGNSVLCRLALGEQSIDATSFTLIRLASGACALWCLLFIKHYIVAQPKASPGIVYWSAKSALSGCLLFAYAAGFSYAYIVLDTGVGALILFGFVQLTMISVSVFKRESMRAMQWCGLVLAFAGLVYLMDSQHNLASSEVTISGLVLMTLAGLAWGFYTLLGRGSVTPLADTSRNFIMALPFSICLLFVFIDLPPVLSSKGIWLALVSGALTSGVGYAIWYFALEGLSRIQAAVVQLCVPLIAALGGLVWANEDISMALIISQIVILGGIALVMFTPKIKPAA